MMYYALANIPVPSEHIEKKFIYSESGTCNRCLREQIQSLHEVDQGRIVLQTFRDFHVVLTTELELNFISRFCLSDKGSITSKSGISSNNLFC